MKRILLVGDSISLYYSRFLATYLAGIAEIYTKAGMQEAMEDLDLPKGANGGDSSMLLEYIRQREAEGTLDYDLFVFNCGLHDIKRVAPECTLQVGPEDYRRNLQEIIAITKRLDLPTVFVNSTPVEDERHNKATHYCINRHNKDLLLCNEIAEEVMAENGIPVIDLYGFTDALPEPKYCDHVHYIPEVQKKHGRFIAEILKNLLTST